MKPWICGLNNRILRNSLHKYWVVPEVYSSDYDSSYSFVHSKKISSNRFPSEEEEEKANNNSGENGHMNIPENV